MWLKILFLVFSCAILKVDSTPSNAGRASDDDAKCGFQTCHATEPEMLNVHLISHTHDDVGWLKTVDQYYYGSNNTIQKASVQYIIDSVIQGLLASPERRFVYVESAFFSKWWNEQTEDLKEQVKMLVNEGRLEFAGGAWSMNDEAAAHYQSIVDQFTWGTRFLNDTFGECSRPRVGWQIDPFGHSREQASLFAKMGYDGLFFARLDFQDKAKRMSDKSMEMVWKSSVNLDDSDIFTGALYDHYYPPSGFCFDILCKDQPFIDDIGSVEYNVEGRVQDFVTYVRKQAASYLTNNIALTMGGDFFWMNSNMWFKSMEKLIKYTNERQNDLKVNVFYSTPSCYLKALQDANATWPTKSDDFFPYANDFAGYWTGYYTSRPTSKRFEREGNQFLQICKQMTAAANLTEGAFERNLGRMREAMGVMQHHDAITGTEKQHVADDYHRELSASIEACGANTKASLNHLLAKTNSSDLQFNFVSCLNLNISDCSVTENSEKFIVNVYNSLAHTTSQFVRFPVGAFNYEVQDSSNRVVASQHIPISQHVKDLPYRTATTNYELLFQASEVPPLGFKSYYVSSTAEAFNPIELQAMGEAFTIGNDQLKINFGTNGLLSTVIVDGETREVSQNFWMYKGSLNNNGNVQNRSEGAYIFRPDPEDGNAHELSPTATVAVFRSENVEEVHQKFNEWISQVVRVYKDEKFVEFEWMVGPIPIEDKTNKDIIIRFTTTMQTNGIFKTDSNGREMLERKINFRETWDLDLAEPVAGNYYPINTKISIEDSTHRLAVLTDRAQGGSSIVDGSVELMVHRRLLVDDYYGVDEALNETEHGIGLVARGKHWMLLGKKSLQSPTLEGSERLLQNRVLMPNWLFFESTSESASEWSSKYTNTFSAIGVELPQNIYLMTYEPWKDNSFLIRFEHVLEKTEDPELSKPVTFNLTEVFPGHDFEFSEVGLAANQWIGDVDRLQFRYQGAATPKSISTESKNQRVLDSAVITMNPMEIRTFIMGMPKNSGIKSQIVFFYFPMLVLGSIIRKINFWESF